MYKQHYSINNKYCTLKDYIYYNKDKKEQKEDLNYLHNLLIKNSFFSLEYDYENENENWQDRDLPVPAFLRYYTNIHTNAKKIILIYVIDGHFKTKKSKTFLKDIKQKIAAAIWKTAKIDNFIPFHAKEGDVFNNNITKMDEFKNTIFNKENNYFKKLAKINLLQENKSFLHILGKDAFFDAARFEVYNLKKLGILSLENTEAIFNKYGNLLNKSFADIRCKAKNVFEWTRDNYNVKDKDYYKKYYKTTRAKKENRMELIEHLHNIHKAKKDKTIEKIKEALNELFKTKQKINLTNVHKLTKISRSTLNKQEYKIIILKAKAEQKAQ